jgi:hypothetical protein
VAAEALMAYRRGDSGDRALVGALLEAEAFDHQRVVAEFCVAFSKSGGRVRR